MEQKAHLTASKYGNCVQIVVDSAGRSPNAFNLVIPQGIVPNTWTLMPLPTNL